MRYRRSRSPNGIVFLTLVTRDREPRLAEPSVRAALSESFASLRASHPTRALAHVVLPDHVHLLWSLPEDGDFSLRVRLLKHAMTRKLGATSTVWQQRFWDHVIRDENDLHRHLDYIHYNPVKHGWVRRAIDWPDSSFRHWVRRGWYASGWGQISSPIGGFGE